MNFLHFRDNSGVILPIRHFFAFSQFLKNVDNRYFSECCHSFTGHHCTESAEIFRKTISAFYTSSNFAFHNPHYILILCRFSQSLWGEKSCKGHQSMMPASSLTTHGSEGSAIHEMWGICVGLPCIRIKVYIKVCRLESLLVALVPQFVGFS